MDVNTSGRYKSKALVKPVSTKRIGKVRRRKIPLSVEAALANNQKMPNMSRKNQTTKIYAFPVFDKCDSLIFFPAQFTSMLNSGDFNNLRRLMKTRFHKDCMIDMCDGNHIDIPLFIKCFECVDQIRPDSIMCVHTTKMIGNQLCCLMYFKFTENRTIREAVSRAYPDQDVVRICVAPDAHPKKLLPFLESKPEKERRKLAKIVYEAEEMIVYGRTYMTLTFDDVTKSVINLDLDSEFTSFRLA